MYGIFMECLVILKLYTGLRLLAGLYLLAVVYLLITEKDKRIRMLMVYAPLVILAVFLCPLFRKYFVGAGLDGETYYRVLWLLPMGVTVAYASCRLFASHKRIGLAVMSGAVIACGSYVYANPTISRAENLYHIPDTVVGICDFLKAQAEGGYIRAVFPAELVHFVRQYDTDIYMPYGRTMLVPQWGYYDAVHEAMEKTEVVDMEALLEASRSYDCNYMIFHESRQLSEDPADLGMELLEQMDGYLIYRDGIAAEQIEEKYGSYMAET